MVTIKTEHPHIVRDQGICGGSPIIAGTRTPVRSIVGFLKLGLSVEDIERTLPYLQPAQIHDAPAYYYDHRDEIEQEIDENREERVKGEVP